MCGAQEQREEKSESLTRFVGVLCHPRDGDAPDLRVTKAQEEGTVGFGHQHVLCLLLVYKAEDCPMRTHTNTHLVTAIVG